MGGVIQKYRVLLGSEPRQPRNGWSKLDGLALVESNMGAAGQNRVQKRNFQPDLIPSCLLRYSGKV